MAVASWARRRSDAGSAAVGTPSVGGLAASRPSARRCSASPAGSRRSASCHTLGAADSWWSLFEQQPALDRSRLAEALVRAMPVAWFDLRFGSLAEQQLDLKGKNNK